MNERALQDAVVEMARWGGWRCVHFRAGQMSNGRWVTPMQGDAGFPDLVLCRGRRLLFVELKSQTGKLEPAQIAWRDVLLGAGQEWYCWRPTDWHHRIIESCLLKKEHQCPETTAPSPSSLSAT